MAERSTRGRQSAGRAATRRIVALIPLLTLLQLAGCAGSGTFLHPEADIGFYEKVGVLPFATLGSDRLAGDKMSSVFTSHLLVSRKFDVAEPGIFLATYAKQVGTTTAPPIGLPQSNLKPIAEETGVQGVFEGTVRDFDYTRATPPRPMISVEVRLVDIETGQVVWSTSVTRVSKPWIPLLGIGGTRTLAELAEEVAAELVGRLPD